MTSNFSPFFQNILFCRIENVTVLRDDAQMPSFFTLTSELVEQKKIEENAEDENVDTCDVFLYGPPHYSAAFKATKKKKNTHHLFRIKKVERTIWAYLQEILGFY